MLPESRNLPRLMAVARALGPLRERVVFVGGATVNLYSTSFTRTPEPRLTDDVNCIVEVAPRTDFYTLEEELRGLGFANDVASGVIYRWQFQGLTVDVMPTEPEILGFSNPWYPMGDSLRPARCHEGAHSQPGVFCGHQARRLAGPGLERPGLEQGLGRPSARG